MAKLKHNIKRKHNIINNLNPLLMLLVRVDETRFLFKFLLKSPYKVQIIYYIYKK